MPYSSPSDAPSYVPQAKRPQWIAVWNSAYKACTAKKASELDHESSTVRSMAEKACESEAFAKANGVIRRSETMTDDLTHQHHDASDGWGLQLEKADPRVDYRVASGGADAKACGGCRFFDAECMKCDLVEGTIDASWICDLWTAPLAGQPMGVQSPSADGYSELLSVFVEVSQAFKDLKPGETPADGWIPFLPKPGKYAHPTYGTVNITPGSNKAMVDSVKNHVYQNNIPLDAEHETKLSGAVGWITDMRMNEDGSADAYVSWTDRGKQLIKGNQFKYVSPEWWDSWKDPATGTVHKNIIAGGAITTRPFFKDKVLRALVASEGGIELVKRPSKEGDDPVPDKKTAAEEAAEAAEAKKAAEEAAAKKVADDAATEAAKKAAEPKLMTAAEVQAKLDEQAKTYGERLAASEAQVATLQAKERTSRFNEMISGKGGATDGARWAGEPAKQLEVLEGMASKFGEDDPIFTAYVENQRAIAAQMAESKLFEEAGVAGGSRTMSDPEQKLEAMAQAIKAADPKKTHAQAYAEAVKSPEGKKLYAEI